MVTINLSPAVESILKDRANKSGLDVAEYARKIIEAAVTVQPQDQKSIDLLEAWERDNATSDPAELSRRQQEFEQFREGMNRNRIEMDGSMARKVYP